MTITSGELKKAQESSILDDFEVREFVSNDSKEYLTAFEISELTGQDIHTVREMLREGVKNGTYIYKWKRFGRIAAKAYKKVGEQINSIG